MSLWKKISREINTALSDHAFLHYIKKLEGIVSKILSLLMIVVILVSIWNLAYFLFETLLTTPLDSFPETLFKVFGLFLNVLIALEILENITAYLKKHVIQVELVIVTSLIAVSRKIIILDLKKIDGQEIIGLGVAVLSLSISYWIIRHLNSQTHE